MDSIDRMVLSIIIIFLMFFILVGVIAYKDEQSQNNHEIKKLELLKQIEMYKSLK